MQASLKGAAALNCMEPHLNVLMEMDRTGHIRTQVTIVGDDYVERHEFQFELDQSYLPPLISELEKILAAYPIKEKAR